MIRLGMTSLPSARNHLEEFAALLRLDLPFAVWEYGQVGRPAFGHLRLLPSGRIGGYHHPNERAWRFSDRGLEFLNDQGIVTARFPRASERPDGRIALACAEADPSGAPRILVQVTDPECMERALRPPPVNPVWFDGSRWRIDIVRSDGLGDALMAVAVLRAFKMRNPGMQVNFYTKYATLFRGLPFLDHCGDMQGIPASFTQILYEPWLPSRSHVAHLIGAQLGISDFDVVPECVVDPGSIDRWRLNLSSLPRPWHIVQRRANQGHTKNKDWPEQNWHELISVLCAAGSVIEIGHAGEGGGPVESPNYLDLRGRTGLQDLVGTVAAGDIYIGPPSGPLHVAAAFHKPIVSILGGFEHPANTAYPNTIALFTKLPCSPCSLVPACPLGLPCQKAISVDSVFEAVRRQTELLTRSSGQLAA